MSKQTTQTATTQRNIYQVYTENFGKYIAEIEREVPQYFQAVSSFQQEFINTWKNSVESAIAVQKEYATKAGINYDIPAAALTAVQDTAEQATKARSVQNQIAIATIDAAKKNIKTVNDSANAFTELNKNLVQSWLNIFTPTRN